MFNKRTLLVLIALTLLVGVAQSGYAGTPINIQKSSVTWLGTKVTGQHDGTIQLRSGEIETRGDRIVGARMVMDMNSIVVLDIEDPKWNRKLLDHLKSDDFFAVDKHPEAIFEMQSLEPLSGSGQTKDANYRLRGDLTIKGITHAISFDARIEKASSGYHAQGSMMVDRTKYGIRYRSGKFFDSLGDRTIHDEFMISFDLVTQ